MNVSFVPPVRVNASLLGKDGGVSASSSAGPTTADRILDALAAAGVSTAFGLPGVHNLEGGIDAWSVAVDPELPRY